MQPQQIQQQPSQHTLQTAVHSVNMVRHNSTFAVKIPHRKLFNVGIILMNL